MSDVTLHAQGAVTGTGRLQPNVQAATAPEQISLWQTYGGGDPNNCRDNPLTMANGTTVYVSPNQLDTIKEGLKRNPAAYPELDEGVRRAMAGGEVLASTTTLRNPDQYSTQFDKAIHDYQAGGGTLTSSAANYGTKDLAKHLFYHGNQFDTNAIPQAHTTGSEYTLKKAIEAEVQRTGKKLNPGDVLRLALQVSNGDTFKATLTAQNLLRCLARGREDYSSQVPKGRNAAETEAQLRNREIAFGSDQNRPFFQNCLETVREPITGAIPDASNDDVFARESGAWYHMFCTATISQKSGGAAASTAVGFEEAFVLATTGSRRDQRESEFDAVGNKLGVSLNQAQAAGK